MKIAIAGCTGRMGQSLLRLAAEFPDITVTCGLVREIRPGALESLQRQHPLSDEFLLTDNIAQAIALSDAIIDFTEATYSLQLAEEVAKQRKILVCGSTGFNEFQKQKLISYGTSACIFQSNNTSIMVHLVADLIARAAASVPAEADIDIMEIHHHHKKDAPSGTAILMAEAAAKGRGVNLATTHQHITPGPDAMRKLGTITTTSLRMGDVIGEHTTYLSVLGERIEISHKALSRDIFARGALRIAVWAEGKPHGFYTMQDVVGK